MSKTIKGINNLSLDETLFRKVGSYNSLTLQEGTQFSTTKTLLYNNQFILTAIIINLIKEWSKKVWDPLSS